MKGYTLKDILGIEVKDTTTRVILGFDDRYPETKNNNFEDDMVKIKMLYSVALKYNFMIYYDGRYVIEPYEGYDEWLEEHPVECFYYYNSSSYLVFRDETGVEVAFQIKYLKDEKYEDVYNLTLKAWNYTKEHKELSDYTCY